MRYTTKALILPATESSLPVEETYYGFFFFHHNKFMYWVNISFLKLPLISSIPEAMFYVTVTSPQLSHLIFRITLRYKYCFGSHCRIFFYSALHQLYYWTDLSTSRPSTVPSNAGSPVQKTESSSSLVVPEESLFSPSLDEPLWMSDGVLSFAGGS